jgi:hypothetical protein
MKEKMMKHSNSVKRSPNRLGRYALAMMVAWTVVIAGFTFWDIYQVRKTTHVLASKEARTILKKDLAFRSWATNHGGVYVPTTEKTPPNPYLIDIPERDIVTPSGKKS